MADYDETRTFLATSLGHLQSEEQGATRAKTCKRVMITSSANKVLKEGPSTALASQKSVKSQRGEKEKTKETMTIAKSGTEQSLSFRNCCWQN